MADPLDLYEPQAAPGGLLRPYQPPDPLATSALGAGAHAFAAGVAPAAGGVAAFPIGAAAGAAAGVPLDPFTFGGASVVLGGAGGLATSFAGADAVARLQKWSLDALTGGGYSRQLDDDAQLHPLASWIGGALPQALLMKPGRITLPGAVAGAAIGGGIEAGSEYAQTGTVDPLKVAGQAAFGALLQHNNRLGDIAQAPAVALAATVQRGVGSTAARIGANLTVAQALRAVPDADAHVAQAVRDLQDPNMSSATRLDLARSRVLQASLGVQRTPDELAAGHVIEGDALTEATRPPDVDHAAHGNALTAGLAQAGAGAPVDVAHLAQPSQSLDRNSVIRFVLNDLEGGAKVVHYNGADGGTTKYGIAAADNPGVDVANLSEAGAADIARRKYWFAGLDQADPRVAAVAFDAGYISGPKVGREILAEAGGDPARALELYREHLNHVADTVAGKAKYREGWNNRVDKLAARIEGAPAPDPDVVSVPGEADAQASVEDPDAPALTSFLPREDNPDVYQRLDDATDRVGKAQEAVTTAEQAIQIRKLSDTVALIDPDTAPLVQSYEQDRDRPDATNAQRAAATRQIDLITQGIGKDVLDKAENDAQIGLKKRVESERASLKAAKKGQSFAQTDLDTQARQAKADFEARQPEPVTRPPAEHLTAAAEPVAPPDGLPRNADRAPAAANPQPGQTAQAPRAPGEEARAPAAEPANGVAPVRPDDSRAAARFSEPGGAGQQAQTASLDHDVRMAVEADPSRTVKLEGEAQPVKVAQLLEQLDADDAAIAELRACATPNGAKT